MGTYFHGDPSEIAGRRNGLQTLILMNPSYVGYSDNNHPPQPSQSSGNFVFLNSNSSANHQHSLPHAPPSETQHFVGIPLQGADNSPPNDSPHDQHDVSAIHGFLPPRVHYNLYNLPVDLGPSREVTRAQQGLSLSLSSQQPHPGYGSLRAERPEAAVPSQATAVSPQRWDDARVPTGSPSPASAVTNSVNGVLSVLFSSKYLRAAQELLDEVVSLGRGVIMNGTESFRGKNIGDASTAAPAACGDRQSGGDSIPKHVSELTTAERQEIQMKKAKLVNMLDVVDQRYRQYHHQIQMVISWFEQAAGHGSAKTYTALALDTISKQFRCLKDAIVSQIKAASKSLGEEEAKIEGSRLKYVDNHIRQQKALQQLGMIQHNAWRPQRGLPERSVSVLRAWLFEHFLHPYPKDSDKLMLAKQTGLTRSQVSNWFINARVRLWKPMVEEMYMEEMKEHDRNDSEDNKTRHNEDAQAKSPNNTEHHHHHHHNNNNNIAPKQDTGPINQNPVSPPDPTTTMIHTSHIPGFNIMVSSPSLEIETMARNSPKKQRICDMLSSATNDRQGDDGFTLMGAPTNFIGGFGSHPMGELGRFVPDQFHHARYSGNNGVSLTLGLPHCDNLGGHHSFMPDHQSMQIAEANDFGRMNAQTNANNVYENLSIQDRKRFATQLLSDFVA